MLSSIVRSRFRLFRTGFIPSDRDYLDPHSPLFATNPEPRFADDPTLQASVLERSNVGVGTLQLRRLDEQGVTSLYRKLRDLEVNVTKKAVFLGDVRQSEISDYKTLLLMAETSHTEQGRMFFFEYFRCLNDLVFLVRDYRKPLVTLASGNFLETSALPFLSRLAAVEKGRGGGFCAKSLAVGFAPTGGMSYLLGRLPMNLGPFLALTQSKLKDADLVFAGLAKNVMSSDSLSFMETTSANFQQVAEQDVLDLISDHFLSLQPDATFSLAPFLPVINDCFGYRTLDAVKRRLKEYAGDSAATEQAKFARFCLQKVTAVPSLAAEATLSLIAHTSDAIRESGGDSPDILASSLKLETRVAARLIRSSELKLRLARHFKLPCSEDDREEEEDVDSLFEPLDDAFSEFHYVARPEFSLSSHPKLRRYNPDFDPRTGLDHDPAYMRRESSRWSDRYLAGLRAAAESTVF